MKTAELKIDIISSIANINNISFLKEIQKLINFEKDEKIFIVNDRQKVNITAAQLQYKNGEILSDKQANDEIDKWLEK